MLCTSPCVAACVTQCANPLGYAKGEHKLLNVQITFGNLTIEKRFSFDVIQLVAVALHAVVMDKKQAGIFAGVDEAGKRIADNNTLSDDFKELDAGRWFDLVDSDGSLKRWRLRGWLIVVAADYPQAQGMGPYMEGVQALCHCRGCNYQHRSRSVHSFFHKKPKWVLRSHRGACVHRS